MRNAKRHHERLIALGEADFLAGKPIGAFYDAELARHNELERASYEVGWRAAKAEAMARARFAAEPTDPDSCSNCGAARADHRRGLCPPLDGAP